MTAYKVSALDKNSKAFRTVLVRAADKAGAESAGKYWLRVMGAKARRVSVSEYRPQDDPTIRQYLRPVS